MVDEMKKEIQEKDELIDALMNEKNMVISKKDAEIAKKDAEIEALKAMLTEKTS